MSAKERRIVLIIFISILALGLGIKQYFINLDSKRADEQLLQQEIRDYLSCKDEPIVCAKLYPNAAKKVAQAETASTAKSQ